MATKKGKYIKMICPSPKGANKCLSEKCIGKQRYNLSRTNGNCVYCGKGFRKKIVLPCGHYLADEEEECLLKCKIIN